MHTKYSNKYLNQNQKIALVSKQYIGQMIMLSDGHNEMFTNCVGSSTFCFWFPSQNIISIAERELLGIIPITIPYDEEDTPFDKMLLHNSNCHCHLHPVSNSKQTQVQALNMCQYPSLEVAEFLYSHIYSCLLLALESVQQKEDLHPD